MPPNQPIGSIIDCGDRWQVQIPVDRDATTGKLIYHRATIRGRKRDAEAYRAEVLASVPLQKVAPIRRERVPRPKKLTSLLHLEARLRLHRVEILDSATLRVRCAVCKHEWSIERTSGGKLPRLSWRCPNILVGNCAGGYRAPGPTRRQILDAYRYGVGGRPPISKWSRETVIRFHPSTLSDAELLVIWGRRDWSDPRPILHREIIGRGLWRDVLKRPTYFRHARAFVESIENALEKRDQLQKGPKIEAEIGQATIIVESGLFAHLHTTLRGVEEARSRIECAKENLFSSDLEKKMLRRKRRLPAFVQVPEHFLI